ncbi:hypothetical protein ABE85_06970 [Mitsuaria sp. 7]|nr:hypothetical protein ABE85_06970 [Mitsuaria sp. 7]
MEVVDEVRVKVSGNGKGGVASPAGRAGRRSCSSDCRGASAPSPLREGPGSELRRAFRPPSSDDIRRSGAAPPPVEVGDPGVAGVVGVGACCSRSSSMPLDVALDEAAGKPPGGKVIDMEAVLQ